MRPVTSPILLGLTVLAVLASCGEPERALVAPPEPASVGASAETPHASETATLRAVRAGNAQAVVAAPALVPPGVPLTPFIEARLLAIANIAIHDAVNAITPRYARYADTGPLDPDANGAAAALTAAHDAIVGGAPGATASTDAWYAAAMADVAGDGIARGVAIGQRAAAAILARRSADGVAAGGVGPYIPDTGPGDYRFTAPFDAPPFSLIFPGTGGFADASEFATTVTPFVVASPSQFRAPRPYGAASNAAAVLTPRYTADFAEISALGCDGCAARSAEQTEIALFWMESSPDGWNRIARTRAEQRHLDAAESARLFALLHLAEFDAYLASADSKYFYRFWRPVTAVALAATDGNPATSSTAGWQVLAFPTPPVPDYPSAHATAGGAAAAVMEAVMPGRGPTFSTTSNSLAGVTRSFASVADAARENADSRVYIGYHFRHAAEVGLAQGRSVGAFVVSQALSPLRGPR
jgi:hypothetical protein